MENLFLGTLTSLLVIGLSTSLLVACQVASPITTTKDFLLALKQDQYAKATELVVTKTVVPNQPRLIPLTDIEKSAWAEKTKKKLGQVQQFTVQNALPLPEASLKEYGAAEGYEVFYFLESDLNGSKNLKGLVFKINGTWKLLLPDF